VLYQQWSQFSQWCIYVHTYCITQYLVCFPTLLPSIHIVEIIYLLFQWHRRAKVAVLLHDLMLHFQQYYISFSTVNTFTQTRWTWVSWLSLEWWKNICVIRWHLWCQTGESPTWSYLPVPPIWDFLETVCVISHMIIIVFFIHRLAGCSFYQWSRTLIWITVWLFESIFLLHSTMIVIWCLYVNFLNTLQFVIYLESFSLVWCHKIRIWISFSSFNCSPACS